MLVVDTVTDAHTFAQTWNHDLAWALSGIRRKAILARIPVISSLFPKRYFSYVGKNIPLNGLLLHGGGPMYVGWTIEDKVCQNPLDLDPNDPDFIEKTSGGLKRIAPKKYVPLYPNKVIGNFTSVNRMLTNVSQDWIAAAMDRLIFPAKNIKQEIEAYLRASGEFHRERLLAPNFPGSETFRITFPGLPEPDYFPK